MKVFESKRSRRLLVRLERGEEVVAALEALARRESISAGWARGLGALEWVELDRHDQARRAPEPPQRFETACEILALEGNLSMAGGAPRALLHATLARRTDNGVEVLGGRLRAGKVFSVELAIDCFEDLALTRSPDAATGLALWEGPSEHPVPASRAPSVPSSAGTAYTHAEEPGDEEDGGGPVSWADVAAVSAAPEPAPPRRGRASSVPDQRRAREEPPDEVLPQKGDWVDHRQFGVCKIDRENEDGGLVIRLPSGLRKTIKLDFMDVGQPRVEGNKRVFPLRPRQR